MQSYHFARIHLLHHQPLVSTAAPCPSTPRSTHHASPGSSLAPCLASYASILQQSRAHAKEIVAIGLGRSDEGTRIHSVQPLWTAGLVLGGSAEDDEVWVETEGYRKSVVEQLRGIERDMGWASEYRVRSLLELWGLPPDWAGVEV
ncbi:Fungal specific transcription factor domain [Teratosphaeria destructans]|uniref:Fungal specific transcription factor domain n=1 Tax=Teratosphaeria destructans TaxID=418781 RepID=A0A9W7SLX3_9PEZI|nr:Fungal specific transcription factor domain [Teratosphaeria destructans]